MMSCGSEINSQGKAFLTPPVSWRSQRSVPVMPCSERKPRRSPQARVDDLFHVIHKVPAGDSPYVRAKHVQLIDKDPSKAISLFWSAINSGDRVDSALKDMAVVMKQLDRSDEAIEAIKSFRHLCAPESQESLDNVLVELYKKSNRIEEEIEVLLLKLKHIEDGIAFGGKQTKLARSQGKKVNITIEKEYSRLLGNLAWAYVQQRDYKSAEEFYRKALSLEPDKNKQCNLAICLMHMNKVTEARFLLRSIRLSANNRPMDESYAKSYERAVQMMDELESGSAPSNPFGKEVQTPVTNWNRGGISQQNTSFCRRDENWRSLPFNGGGIPRVPYTQPRRREERATIDCSRKLLFEQPRGGPLNNGINMRNEHRLKEIAENTMENLKQVQGNDTNRKSILDFSSFKSKKSWADMVDEEEQAQEQKLLNEIHNYGADDENTNYNITPNQPLSDLEGGLYTQPGNHNVRRSLCFDKKGDALNFDSNDSMLTEGCNSSSNDVNLLNRTRLQVFCDITPNNSRLVS